MPWITVVAAAKLYNVRPSQIHDVRLSGKIPKWMEKRGNTWHVKEDHNSLLLHLKSKTKKSTAAKVGHARARRRKATEKHEINVLSMSETEKLQELSIQAELSKPITGLRLEQYKIENQKLKLEQQAGDLISRSMADFLFTGYLDRLNRELLTYQNKLESDFDLVILNLIVRIREGEDIVSADIAREMKKLIVKETEDIIRNVKSTQITTMKKWALSEGIVL